MIVMAEAFHPSIYIKDELEARGWSTDDLAKAMPGDYGINRMALDFYLEIGPDNPTMHLGSLAIEVSRAFGVDDSLFPNLERSWLDHPTTKAAALKELH